MARFPQPSGFPSVYHFLSSVEEQRAVRAPLEHPDAEEARLQEERALGQAYE